MSSTPEQQLQQWLIFLFPLFLWVAFKYRRRWTPSGYAHGTARWASENDLRRNQMFAGNGLTLGRTRRKRKVIRLPNYQHLAAFAPTGAGKGVSFVIPTLLDYRRGSVFVFDPKGELYSTTAAVRKAMRQRVIRIDPFAVCGPGGDSLNPLNWILRDAPTLIDEARAMAEAMIVRPPDGEKDPHWNNSAAMLLTVMISATLLIMKEERNLSTVREMMTDPSIFKEVIARLQDIGGIPARLANQLAKQSESEKEFAGVMSTANTHCAYLDSELVAATVNNSSFSADVLLEPGTTIYFILPVEHLDAQRGFLRLVVTALLRHIMQHGVKKNGETLFVLDECAALSGLESLEQAFVLGRGKGIRLYTFWQSVEQAQAAFKKTPNLVSDNSDAQIYFGVNSYPTADLVSKTLGTWTMVTETANVSESGSSSYSPDSPGGGRNRQTSWSSSRNYQEHARQLLNPSEVMQLRGDYLIAFIKGVPPILARRLKYYADPLFRRPRMAPLLWWVLLVAVLALLWSQTTY